MASFPTLLSPESARAIILQNIYSLPTEVVLHENLLHRTLSEDIVSTFDLPPFDNSAMDGFALRADDLRHVPRELVVKETIGAGQTARARVEPGSCIKIMTGARIPLGADCVVMREETQILEGGKVRFLQNAKCGQNIRRAGSDVSGGEIVLRAGSKLTSSGWAMLASLGMASVSVFRVPRVGIISTGRELTTPGNPLKKGAIYDSNSYALQGMTLESGAIVAQVRRVGDEPHEFLEALEALVPLCDVIISSGGVSMGDFDPVRDVLLEHAHVHFWKIAVKPGKPVFFASFRETPVFGLPGNPVSVMVTFEEFVRPALLRLSGRRALWRPEIEAELVHDVRRSVGRAELMRARVWFKNGKYLAKVQGEQGSGRLSSTVGANALLAISAEVATLKTGEKVVARLILSPEEEF